MEIKTAYIMPQRIVIYHYAEWTTNERASDGKVVTSQSVINDAYKKASSKGFEVTAKGRLYHGGLFGLGPIQEEFIHTSVYDNALVTKKEEGELGDRRTHSLTMLGDRKTHSLTIAAKTKARVKKITAALNLPLESRVLSLQSY